MAVVLVGTVFSAQAENPTNEIAKKNAFGLKQKEVEVPTVAVASAPAPANIILTGMAKLSGRKQVFLKLAQPGETQPKYLRLGEKDREAGVEVLEINLDKGWAKINYQGKTSELTFDSNGAQAVAFPVIPAPVVPGAKPERK